MSRPQLSALSKPRHRKPQAGSDFKEVVILSSSESSDESSNSNSQTSSSSSRSKVFVGRHSAERRDAIMMVLPLLRDILRTSQAQRRTDRQNVRQALLTAEDRGIMFWGQSPGQKQGQCRGVHSELVFQCSGARRASLDERSATEPRTKNLFVCEC